MECYNEFNQPMDPEQEFFSMPTRVVLEPTDNEEDVLHGLEQRYNRLVEQWREQELARYESRETRYDSGLEQPSFPIVTRSTQLARPYPSIVLPDGRRARLLDRHRLETQCGVKEILQLEDLRTLARATGPRRRCPSCGGLHLPVRTSATHTTTTTTAPIACPKCKSDLRSSSYWDGPDTLVCIHCGKRITRPLAQLTHEEEQANSSAIDHLLATTPVLETEGEDPSPVADPQEAELSDHEQDEELEHRATDDGEDTLSPYDEDVTIDTLPETTPLDVAELVQIQALLDSPSKRWDTEGQPIVIQHLLALTNRRLESAQDDDAFKTVFAQVVAEEVGHLGDLLHDPACQLFKSSSSPLRQVLLDRAIQAQDSPETRMAIWAAAGRLLQESNISWLKDFHRAAADGPVPTDRKARAEFWRTLQQAKKAEAQPIIDWLYSLSKEDLAQLAGDPESSHPFVHHPDPDVFQSTDTLVRPLIQFLANELQRFRQKTSGCAILAGDYGLAVETLTAIAVQSGQLPARSTPPHTAAA